MASVLIVPASESRHPMLLVILMKAYNLLIHKAR